MKTLAYSIAILAIGAQLGMPASAGQAGIQNQMSEFNQMETTAKTKQMSVRSAAQVKRAFDLAAKERGRQAIEISCSPADSQWCSDDFVQACEDHDGGASSNPEGGVTCSLPQWD
jgi:hypothetical protein